MAEANGDDSPVEKYNFDNFLARAIRRSNGKSGKSGKPEKRSIKSFEMSTEPGVPGFDIVFHYETGAPTRHHFPSKVWRPFVRCAMQMIDILDCEFRDQVARKARQSQIHRRQPANRSGD